MKRTHLASRSGKLVTFLREELELSANLTQKLVKQGQVQVNGSPARLYQKIVPGDQIFLQLVEDLPGYPPEPGPLEILYEDEAVIALDKPAGLVMHPTAARPAGTLAGRLVAYYQQTGQRCGIHFVSRLDRDTFGVVLAAKNGWAHAQLAKALEAGKVCKTYRAAVYGVPAEAGDIVQPLGRVPGDPLLRCVQQGGQYAKSTYRRLETDGVCSLLELHPITGRTNQLRVHCAWMGCPILGDSQYGTEASQTYSLARGYRWQQLCAVSLTFPHPVTGAVVTVASRQGVTLPTAPGGTL